MDDVNRAEQLLCECGHVHLIGIGGIGMAGIAWLLKERGFSVSGCDLQTNRQTAWLQEHGISVFADHSADHISASVDWLIRSTAVPDSHPEVLEAKKRGIAVSRRGEVLPALMRDRISIAVSGTHGKTTTTAMIAQVLNCGFFVGGEVGGMAAVAHDGEIMVVEADESDGTVAGYTPDYSIITNIEYDHMEHHDSEEAFIGCFEKLINNTRKKVFYCAGDAIASRICSGNPKCEPYFFPESHFDLPLMGLHNQWNAAAVRSVCSVWMSEKAILAALKNIEPIGRRFETVYENRGIRIISDYAHHPTEVSALIQTAQELQPQRLLGVFQPHRYTRTRALGKNFPPSFEGIDQLWLVPVYPASEQPLEGGTTADLAKWFPNGWNERLHCCSSLQLAWADIQKNLRDGDVLLIIGAGDIECIAHWAKNRTS